MSHAPRLKVTHLTIASTLFCIAVAFSPAALAQVSAPFIGSWKATWQTDAKSYDAVLNVTEKGGSWQTYVRNENNPCAGREIPMKVESASPTEVRFLLQFSETIPGCQNVKVVLQATPDGKVTGTRSKYELTLVRQ
jgi:hypothetical protein